MNLKVLSESNRLKQSTAAKLFNKAIPIAGMAVLTLATVSVTGNHFLLKQKAYIGNIKNISAFLLHNSTSEKKHSTQEGKEC